ncbi:SDR family NAD(P)-dependent oxidoreductase [Streptomyces sp. NPDC057253]|uniref:SDR family NAD(P)-dependent oxidoreductase n=1 Tax=Streptomyces sp. NPDC057253 TaxID=3346069 RepID=UPI003635CFF1
MSKAWIITGAGRGLGREFAATALSRGDRVAATARDTAALDDLVKQFGDAIVPLQLDVTDREQAFSVVQEAHDRLGRLDVVVNNAGYGLFGAVEEISVEQLRHQLEVNLFGVLNVTQAALPLLRAQGSGHIVQISTVGGVAAFPLIGGYHASKWALEGLTESLAQEVAGQGIHVTLVEPGGFATDWAGDSAVWAEPQTPYDPLRAAMAAQRDSLPAGMIGDPKAAGPALLKIVDAEQPPLRVFFGAFPTQLVPDLYQSRLDTWEAWKQVALEANGNGATITSVEIAGH